MKLTYVILAHNNPKHLLRLVMALSKEHVRFVIHIDLNSSLESFTRLFTYSDLKKIHFIKKRIQSEWGSFGLVQATLNCFRYILKKIPETERVIMLSGQDYPIKSNNYIEHYLSANKDIIFMNYFKLPYSKWPDGGRYRFPYYYEINDMIPIYSGSQWMSFPMHILPIIFAFLKLNHDFIPYFKAVTIPDESFFQTLLINCEEKIISENLVNHGLHLIKWDPPFSHPREFTEKNFNLLKKSKFLFARKFQLDNNSVVLDRIDEEILCRERKQLLQDNYPKTSVNSKTCILFLTDNSHKVTLNAYRTLLSDMEDTTEIFMLFHKKRRLLPNAVQVFDPMIFENDILTTLGFEGIENKLVPGSNHFPLFKFYNEYPNFEYYWFVEDDVRFNGNWKNFFSYFKENHSENDFLSSHIKEYQQEPGWHWWYTLKNSSGSRITNQNKIRSFNPIFRISNRALRYLKNVFLSGWSGHHEVSLPTLLNYAGFKISDFGGDGKYTPPGFKNKFYKSGNEDYSGVLKTGTMRYRPIINPEEITEEVLYHPVKFDNKL